MSKKLKVLLLMDEVWNDSVYGNNNMTNWFSGFLGAEFASVCCSEGTPQNSCCTKYFQITDKMMFKSLFSKKRAGIILEDKDYSKTDNAEMGSKSGIIGEISKTHMDIFRLVRDLLWLLGRYDKKALIEFIEDFKPDIIFSVRRATVKMLRLERELCQLSGLPIAAFTGDNELEEGVPMISPFSLIRKAMIRRDRKSVV